MWPISADMLIRGISRVVSKRNMAWHRPNIPVDASRAIFLRRMVCQKGCMIFKFNWRVINLGERFFKIYLAFGKIFTRLFRIFANFQSKVFLLAKTLWFWVFGKIAARFWASGTYAVLWRFLPFGNAFFALLFSKSGSVGVQKCHF